MDRHLPFRSGDVPVELVVFLEELQPEFSDVESDRMHCDAAIMNLVRWPEKFDTIVASNLFGDLLTDLGGILGGGLGLAPSTNTNPLSARPPRFDIRSPIRSVGQA